MSDTTERAPASLSRLRAFLRMMYFGERRQAFHFRLAILAIDVAIIAFFVAAPFLERSVFFYAVDYAIAALLALDLAARGWAHGNLKRWLKQPIVWIDLFVLITLLFPVYFFNLGFLRVLRLWTLVHTDLFWKALGRGRYDDTRVEDVTKSAVNLVVFIFIATGFVYTSFAGQHEKLITYLDALYFTITTLTTTGFGDITLPTAWGKWLSIIIMVVGVTLFVRLGQTLLRPHKVLFPCPECGLMRHDLDAVHCKACGVKLKILNEAE